ncbi:MarR family transcriptional regulator [Burkholderia stabilis]|uniref:Salmolysin,transcriptional regulator SlyA,homoprotocatechuate degradation operon regulator, HpaR,MarR family n=1 Tax=Burkholderia stabilis TaxID=95485 RepID=A0AAJ5NBD1_9BURK|nr:MarR family transcriptional regulator [Burkholderia stabilis]AOR71237.1 MarR family transcriptional regulator [Burkholderia stabilis]VBB15314.1 Salmolysin,transcriptional regulator SlyA,homoprotocatechuate degradation operon regulator, HpaR,MarR family [Burkholderia stabilis]HDR9490819.1 MarR family transcriptional regulator [Burkholderia stabilis]HDR9523045.1 MarR family transcriptional regulator [Burkholderia stabilis]HDR9530926.1 MarR family transcriptional regulator [Burkholderia stabil
MSNPETKTNPLPLIGFTYRLFARVVDRPLRELGFAMSQVPVLVSLKKAGALSQTELARRAQVEQPSMAQLLNRMERDGLVLRVPDPHDGRSRLISLTDSAAKGLARCRVVMDDASEQALAGLSDAERDQLAALLGRVNANLERMTGLDRVSDIG